MHFSAARAAEWTATRLFRTSASPGRLYRVMYVLSLSLGDPPDPRPPYSGTPLTQDTPTLTPTLLTWLDHMMEEVGARPLLSQCILVELCCNCHRHHRRQGSGILVESGFNHHPLPTANAAQLDISTRTCLQVAATLDAQSRRTGRGRRTGPGCCPG